MRYRTLGLGGPRVSAIGLGCLGMTGGYGPVDTATCEATARKALDLGVTLFDVADFYADGAVEELIGRAVAGRRDEAVIATRGGLRSRQPGGPPTIVDGSPTALRAAVDASLLRLGTGHIDLYYLGRVDPRVPVEESVGALASCVEAGKIRYVGLSEATPDELRRAHAVHRISALESEYSLWDRHVEESVLPTARSLGVGFTAHTPLGKGFLTGKLTDPGQLGPMDYRRRHPRFQGTTFADSRRMIEAAREELAGTGIPLARFALAWLLSRGTDIVPIPGTVSVRHLEENAVTADFSLKEEDVARIMALILPAAMSGSRQPARG